MSGDLGLGIRSFGIRSIGIRNLGILAFGFGIVVVCGLGLGWSRVALAQEKFQGFDRREIEERAERRLYPGGMDEENIKVQPEIPVGNRKLTLDGLDKKIKEQEFEDPAAE